MGQVRTVADGAGWHTLTCNLRGYLTSVQAPQHPSSGFLTYDYEAVGNRTLVQSWLGRQTMLYDGLDRCTCMLDPDSKLTTWLYDGLNRPTMQFNCSGCRATSAYDARPPVWRPPRQNSE